MVWVRIAAAGAVAALSLLLLLSTAASGGSAQQPLIGFRVTGGFGGGDQRLTIYPDGRATIVDSRLPTRKVRLPRAAVRQLRRLLVRLPFSELRDSYESNSADIETYEVTFGGRTVRAQHDAQPPKLFAMTAQLYNVIQEARLPFLVQVTLYDSPPLRVTVRRDRSTNVSSEGEEPTRRLSPRCFALVRHAVRSLRTSALKPGFVPLGPRNPPPTMVVTHRYSTFHTRIANRMPRRAAQLLKRVRSIAARRCK
jgi:hypothetical protein